MNPFYIVGPTGSGKSAVALKLAQRWGGEIVNADAYQLYAGIPTITAAPSSEDKSRVPHHLYEVCALEEELNVVRYVSMAEAVINEIQGRGRRAIVVGGSGLYIKGLTHGLADSPPGDPGLRQAMEEVSEADRVAWLQKLDLAGARQMNLRNPRYVMRALEMTLLAGVPASVLKAGWKRDEPEGVEGIAVSWERAALYERINRRVESMIQGGALEEVAALPETVSQTALKAIGVREIQAYLRGDCSLHEAIEAIQQASRRYAKRQGSWFRRESIFRNLSFDEACALELFS